MDMTGGGITPTMPVVSAGDAGGAGGAWNNPVWPLVWLAVLGRNNGLFGGGENGGVALADAVGRIQQDVSAGNLANCQQTAALQGAISGANSATLEAINRSAADAAACCCNARIDTLNQGSLTREAINNGTFVTQAGFKDLALENCQNTNQLAAAIAACCCETQKEILNQSNIIQGVGSSLSNQIQMQTMQLNESSTRNTQAILGAINDLRIEGKDAQIANLTNQLNQCRIDASQSNQTNTILAQANTLTQQSVAAILAQFQNTNGLINTCCCGCPPGAQAAS